MHDTQHSSNAIRPSVALTTLGCKLNQAETEELARKFRAAGFAIVDFDERADAYVVNTCSVTHIADRKSRQIMRQARRLNPSAIIAATGCYVEVSPQEVESLPDIDLVVVNRDKARIAELVGEAVSEHRDCHRECQAADLVVTKEAPQALPLTRALCSPDGRLSDAMTLDGIGRVRSFVKIEEGCNKFCSFCIVPLARGRERSVPVEEVVRAVAERVAAGHKEIVLTGVHLGTYGRDLQARQARQEMKRSISLNILVQTLLERTTVARLRISSFEPMDFHPELLATWSSDRVCRHIHLPLQSGSDAVLKRMRRRYDKAEFARIVEQIRAAIPDVAITTDIIAGFPGESDAEFRESYDFVRDMRFAALHVFKYSPRRGTLAANMPDQVRFEVKKARSAELLRLGEQSARAFATTFLGRTINVLYETQVEERDGRLADVRAVWEGLTDNYLRVHTRSEHDLTNQIRLTRMVDFVSGHLIGQLA